MMGVVVFWDFGDTAPNSNVRSTAPISQARPSPPGPNAVNPVMQFQ